MVKKDFKSTFLNIENEDEIENEKETEISLEEKEKNTGIVSQEDIESSNDKQSKINTSKKAKSAKHKDKVEKADKIDSKEEIVIIKKGKNNQPKIVTTTKIEVVPQTMNDRIQQRIIEVEKEIKNLKRVGFGTGKKKIPFDDMYGGKTISMNRYLKPLFEEICLSSSITRAEIIEQILINGIKNTNFNPPQEDE